MKKILLSVSLCFIVAVASVILLTSCDKYKDILSFAGKNGNAKQYDYHIVVSVHPDNTPWRNSVLNWAWKAREELERDKPGVIVDVVLARDEREQAMQLHTLARKGHINALVIMADVPESVANYCREFRRKNTLVIAVHNNIVFPQCPNVLISGDNSQIGYEGAKALVNALQADNSKKNILLFSDFSNPAILARASSFREVLTQYMNLTITEINYKDIKPTPFDAMQVVLEENAHIDAVWTGWDSILEDAMRAYSATGRQDIKIFVGGNGSKNVNKLIAEGNSLVSFNTTYPPKMMYDAIMLAFDRLASPSRTEQTIAPPEFLIYPTEVITKDNVMNYLNSEDAF